MQNNDYLTVDIMPKKTRFNRFFYPERLNGLKKKFKGLCYLYDLPARKQTVIQKHPERFKIEMCGNSPARVLLFGPIIIGFVLSLLLLLSCIVMTYSDEPYHWWVPILTFSWNLFFLNLLPITESYIPKKQIYFDRKKQLVGFTYDIPGCEERDELGNCCFKWADIVCHLDIVATRPGVMGFVPFISHIDEDKYPETKIAVQVPDNSNNPMNCYLYWERVVRFMDSNQPLPDVPEYESCRHLDELTAEFDKHNNRPDKFWSDFSIAQQVEIWRKFNKEAAHFNWLRATPNEEITKPWLHFKGEPERIEKLTWKYKAKRLALQLFIGIP
jgi:hypothetical protein